MTKWFTNFPSNDYMPATSPITMCLTTFSTNELMSNDCLFNHKAFNKFSSNFKFSYKCLTNVFKNDQIFHQSVNGWQISHPITKRYTNLCVNQSIDSDQWMLYKYKTHIYNVVS